MCMEGPPTVHIRANIRTPKVTQLDSHFRIEENVFGLYITVRYSRIMQILDSINKLGGVESCTI